MEAGSVAVAVSGNEWGQSARSVTARMGPMRGGSLPVGVSNLIGALVNPLIDLKLHEIQAGSCPSAEWPPPPPPPSADAQDWSQSQIIKAVDFVLNDAVGASGALPPLAAHALAGECAWRTKILLARRRLVLWQVHSG